MEVELLVEEAEEVDLLVGVEVVDGVEVGDEDIMVDTVGVFEDWAEDTRITTTGLLITIITGRHGITPM